MAAVREDIDARDYVSEDLQDDPELNKIIDAWLQFWHNNQRCNTEIEQMLKDAGIDTDALAKESDDDEDQDDEG